MTEKTKAYQIAKELMYDLDAFSQWLGIEIEAIEAGSAQLRMQVREEMTNGFGIAHGGITYSLADSAFAFASNSRGRHAVSIETGISHTAKVYPGDWLRAIAVEEYLGNRIANYRVEVKKDNGEVVALFKGTVYRSSKDWLPEPED